MMLGIRLTWIAMAMAAPAFAALPVPQSVSFPSLDRDTAGSPVTIPPDQHSYWSP